MKDIAQNSSSSNIISLLLVVLVMPNNIAKPFTVLIISLILISQYRNILNAKYFQVKVILLVILLPGLVMTIYKDFEEVIRFMPILLMILMFPYSYIKINLRKILITSIVVLIYIIATQYLIGINNSSIINLRNTYYPMETNIWNYGYLGEDSYVFDRQLRFGGIFYNPNVCASNVFMYFACSIYALNSIDNPLSKKIIFLLVVFFTFYSLFLTGSRTFIVGICVFMAIKYMNIYEILLKKKVGYQQLAYLILLFSLLVYVIIIGFESVVEGLLSEGGSANEKNEILIKYLQYMLSNDISTLIFGGAHKIQFDADLGSIIGAFGILGFIGIGIFYIKCIQEISDSVPFVLTVIIASIGNTIIYNLAASLQVFIVLVVVSQINIYQNK